MAASYYRRWSHSPARSRRHSVSAPCPEAPNRCDFLFGKSLDTAAQAADTFPDVVEDGRFVAAPQVEVFQPDQVALPFHPADDGLTIGDAGENGGDKAGGADAGIVKRLHCRQPPLDADCAVHVIFEVFIQCIDGPGDTGVRESLDQVQIPQDKVAFGSNTDFDPAAFFRCSIARRMVSRTRFTVCCVPVL